MVASTCEVSNASTSLCTEAWLSTPHASSNVGRKRVVTTNPACQTSRMTDGWTLAAQARREFANMVDELTSEQTKAESLCAGWSAHDVTGHVVTFVDVPLPKFVWNVMSSKGDFDKASTKMARQMAKRPMSDLVAAIRTKAGKKSALPMFPGEMTAMDTVVHTQDVRRALDLPGAPSPELIESALTFLTTNKRAGIILKKGALDGLRFEATDLDWSHGDGALVRGRGEALMMQMLGRNVADELTGDGVATLSARKTT
jgi:uncharacterized protein (TIGR03083 family)